MSIKKKIFDTEPLLADITKVVSVGLHKLLKDFIHNHEIYKKTHESVLRIASNQTIENCENENEKTIKQSITEMT